MRERILKDVESNLRKIGLRSEIEMLERFYSIILPEHNNDEDWMYLLRKRSYETRNCTWTSNEGTCKQLNERGIIDLFMEPLRLIRPCKKSPLTETRKIFKKEDIKQLDNERVLTSVLAINTPFEYNNNNNGSVVTMASIFDFDAQDSKRKREE
jgi:hypothetical protein